MGRGRAKAKQQKVARELKYSSHFTDLDALQRELGASESGSNGTGGAAPADADDDDLDDYNDSDADGWSVTGR
jgi:DUF3073 family protein